MLTTTGALMFAAFCLLLAAALANGPRWQRRSALLSAVGATAAPWFLPTDEPLWRGGLAIWTTWDLGRVIDLTSDLESYAFSRRVWHVFGLVDTRQATFTTPTFDITACGKTLFYAGLATLGLLIGVHSATYTEGTWYWFVRWCGGALFFYSLAHAVEGVVRLLYHAVGVTVPRQHDLPIVSRSVREFWGQRWNRAVGGWLRAHCYLPLARRGWKQRGLLAAFSASAVFHAYFTWAAVGTGMALTMALFFLLQGVFVLLEARLGVARWQPARAHVWTVLVVLGCAPLFIEPILRLLTFAPR